MNWNPNMRNDDRHDGSPPFSRVFVVCAKDTREEHLRPAFEKFGNIESIHIPKDRNGDWRGIAYVKFDKTSSAAAAIGALHMSTLPGINKSIKVMIATQKHENQSKSEEKHQRLFIKVSKNVTEEQLNDHFSKFGSVESVVIQKDKTTSECKGFAYINFKTFLDAAKAFEECDRKYKPIFATPKEELKRTRNNDDIVKYNHGNAYTSNYNFLLPSDDKNNRDPKPRYQYGESESVVGICTPAIPPKCLERLFKIIPGVAQFKYSEDQYNGLCRATVKYDTKRAANHAVETLNNFEFPSGELLSVQLDDNPLNKAANNLTSIVNGFKNSVDSNRDLLQLADAMAQASSLIKAATEGKDLALQSRENFCSVSLPPIQPLAENGSTVAARCFLIFKPQPPPVALLKNAFCRFGDLIDVTTFPKKTFGFARYASCNAAQMAIQTLNDATLCGVKLKVQEADERGSADNKDDNDHDSDNKRIKLCYMDWDE